MHSPALIKGCERSLNECDVSWQKRQCPWLPQRAAVRAVGGRRLLHRRGSSVENISVTVQTSSPCASDQCEYDVIETQGSVGYRETFITTGLRCIPVAQAEVCDVVRPCPRLRAAGGGPDGAKTRPPDTAGSEHCLAPLMAGVWIFERLPKATTWHQSNIKAEEALPALHGTH